MDYLKQRPDPYTFKPGDLVIYSDPDNYGIVSDSLDGQIMEIKEIDPDIGILTFTDESNGLWKEYIRVSDALQVLTQVANNMKERMLCLMKATYLKNYPTPTYISPE